MKAAKYFFRRMVGGVIVLLGVSVLIFVLARVIPGDPARLALGAEASVQQVEALRERLGLNDSLPVQYWNFLVGVSRFDFGVSLYTNRPVVEDIADGLPATVELVTMSMLFVVGFGVLMGALSAHHRDGALDNLFRMISLIGVCAPIFVWAILLMLVFAYFLELLPVFGRLPPDMPPPTHVTGFYLIDSAVSGRWDVFWTALRHLLLPSIALSLPAMGQTARLTRANMMDAYDRQYIEMARAFSFRDREILAKYAMRPAMIPTLTIIGLEFVALLGNAFLVEAVFIWPGMARYGVQTILHKDLNGIVTTVLLMSLFFVVVNLIVDFVVTYVNPRIRLDATNR